MGHVKECKPTAYHSLHLSTEDKAYPHLEIIQSCLNWWRNLDIFHWNSLESRDTTHSTTVPLSKNVQHFSTSRLVMKKC
jgi:hypothetical protein